MFPLCGETEYGSSTFGGDIFDIRPVALSANAYDDYAYSSKGAIIYGIFPMPGPGGGFPGGPGGPVGPGVRVFQGCTGRCSSADGSSTAVRTANADRRSICY